MRYDKTTRLKLFIAGSAAALLAAALYIPSLGYGFINLDDPFYVVNNSRIRSLDISLLQWAFTTLEGGNWHPLTWISLAIDYSIWGLNPAGYRLHNIILHALNTMLVMALAFRVTALYRADKNTSSPSGDYEFIIAALTAIIFGLHPLRVESVVWVTERKDVLCAFFYLASLLAYTSYLSGSGRHGYIISFTAFMLALLSKPMAVTLPLVLLLIDAGCIKRGEARFSIFKSLKNKIPFLLASFAASAAALAGQTAGGGMKGVSEYSLIGRILNPIHSFWLYAYKTILPAGLSPFYPLLPEASLLNSPQSLVSVIFLTSVIVSCVIAFKRGKFFWALLWAYYLITLLPVLGIVQVGDAGAADRFTYLPAISIAVLLSMAFAGGANKAFSFLKLKPSPARVLIAAALPVAAILSPLTISQARIWQDTLTLANRAVETYPDASFIPYLDRGFAWIEKDGFPQAVEDCTIALNMRPDCDKCLFCRAEALEKMGDLTGAISDYNTILGRNPANADALHNRGGLYLKTGDPARAREDFRMRDIIERAWLK